MFYYSLAPHFFLLDWLELNLILLLLEEHVFSGCTGLPDSEETELGSSNQEASPSIGKNTGVVLVPC